MEEGAILIVGGVDWGAKVDGIAPLAVGEAPAHVDVAPAHPTWTVRDEKERPLIGRETHGRFPVLGVDRAAEIFGG
jgi:hypothetical protein